MEPISLGQMIIAWVLAALAAGVAPSGFTQQGTFVGTQQHGHVTVTARLK